MGDFNLESTNIQTHLNILQGCINRMATNSAVCKTLCTTMVAGALAIVYGIKSSSSAIFIVFIFIPVFVILDAIYLSLERGFRAQYCNDVEQIKKNKFEKDSLFTVKISSNYYSFKSIFRSMMSWSILVIYGCIFVAVIVAYIVIQYPGSC